MLVLLFFRLGRSTGLRFAAPMRPQLEQAALQVSVGWPIPTMRRQIVTAIRRAINLAIVENLQPSSRVVVCGKISHTHISLLNKITFSFCVKSAVKMFQGGGADWTDCA
jgi:hypothetical protein